MALFYPHLSVGGGWLTGFTVRRQTSLPRPVSIFQRTWARPFSCVLSFPRIIPFSALHLFPWEQPFQSTSHASSGVQVFLQNVDWHFGYVTIIFFSLYHPHQQTNRLVFLQFWKNALIPLQLTAISSVLFMVLYQKLFCKVVYIW